MLHHKNLIIVMIPIEAGHIAQRVDINEEVYPNMPSLNLLKDQQVADVLT